MTFNRDDYKKRFDNLVYGLILDISKEKGIDGSEYTDDCFIEEVREAIVKVAWNHHLDLAVPEKEFKEGDKIELYYQGVPEKATIVKVGYNKYGLLIDSKIMVVFVGEYDTATDYIIDIEKHHNITYVE